MGSAVAEPERRLTRPGGRVFIPRSQVLNADDVRRALVRIAHEILERNHGADGIVVVGLQTGGVPLARRLVSEIAQIDGAAVPLGLLDTGAYRDDRGIRPAVRQHTTEILVDLDGRVVVLVDDVIFTGRTVRAALDALADHGRARAVQLAVMVDRGHRELPIRPDYVGKNLPTRLGEVVVVNEDGVAIGDLCED